MNSFRSGTRFLTNILLLLRIALSDGAGSFGLLAVCLTLSSATGRWYVADRALSEKQANDALERMLTQEMLPNREERRPGIVAAVLGIPGIPSKFRCDLPAYRMTRGCRDEAAYHEAALAIAGFSKVHLPYAVTESAAAEEVDIARTATAVEIAMAPVLKDPKSSDYPRTHIASRLGQLLRELAAPSKLSTCRSNPQFSAELAEKQSREAHERAYGPALCDGVSMQQEAALLFPPTALDSQPLFPAWAITPTDFDDRSVGISEFKRQSLRLSQVVSVLVGPLRSSQRDALQGEPQLVQAFYMSPDGFIRIWAADNRHPYLKFPVENRWGTAMYVQDLLRTPQLGQTATPVYIDYGQNGLVSTKCTALRDRSGRLLGALCTDVTIPNRVGPEATENLPKENPVGTREKKALALYQSVRVLIQFQSSGPEVLVFDPSGEAKVGESAVQTLSRELLSSDRKLRRDTDEEAARELLEHLIQEEFRDANTARKHHGSTVTQFRFKGQNMFVVPLRRIESPELSSWHILLLRAHQPPGNSHAGFFFTCALFLSAIVTVYALQARLQADRRQREDAILRSLQVGVIAVNGDDVIEMGNDQAEEALRVPLPTVGAGRSEAVPRTALIGLVRGVVTMDMLRASGHLSYDAKVVMPPRVAFEKIDLDRAHGIRSRYYACLPRGGKPAGQLAEPHHWIQIEASPFLDSIGERLRVFAVLRALRESDVDDKFLIEKLDEFRVPETAEAS